MGETHSVELSSGETEPAPGQSHILEPHGEGTTDATDPPETPETTTERPEWLPEKFGTPQDMARAYGELEARLGTGGEQANPAQITKAEEKPPGFNTEKYTAEMIRDGELSQDSVKELKKLGLPDEIVQTHLAGLAAIRDQQVARLNDIAGGAENFQKMASWASANLPESQIDAFNAAIQSGDGPQTELAMRGMVAQFNGTTAGQSTAVEGLTGGPVTQGFESTAQMVEAMKDPRYEKDAAYRKEVMARTAASESMMTRIR